MVAGNDSASSRAGITTLNSFTGLAGGFDGGVRIHHIFCDGQSARCRMDDIIVKSPQSFNMIYRSSGVLDRNGAG
jgi:hypothetical protein